MMINKKGELIQISMSNVESENPHHLKQIILSDSRVLNQKFSIENPFIFNGIIIGLCTKGKAKIKINFRDHVIEQGMIMVVSSNQVIKILEEAEDFFMDYLLISVDLIVNFPLPKDFGILTNIGLRPCMKVSPEAMDDLIEYRAMIIKQNDQVDQFYRVEIVKGLLYSMLVEIVAIYSSQDDSFLVPFSRMEEITNRFFKLLKANCKEQRSVSFYADKICVTSKHLSSVIKKVTQRGVLLWIHDGVIVEAKILLKATDMTIAQVAAELNFANPSFFGQFFKEHTGMTPGEFRDTE